MTTPEDHNPPMSEAAEVFFQPGLTIEAPSVEDEWLRVQNYLTDPLFYETEGYLPRLPLPEQPPFPYYISRIRGRDCQPPSEAELALLRQTFRDKVFDESAYSDGLQLLQQGVPTLETQVFPVMGEHQATLGFYMPPHGYKVTLSRFGTTGSYRTQGQGDDLQSEITVLFTGVEDSELLLERLVHEITHIGLGQRLIRAGDFNHDQKESTIDTYVIGHFRHLFPNYERQGGWTLDRGKLQKVLHDLLYVALLGGVEPPDLLGIDPVGAREVRNSLYQGPRSNNYATLWRIADPQSAHRVRGQHVNPVLSEHRYLPR